MSTTYEPIGNTVLVEAILPSTSIAIPSGYDVSEGGKYRIVALGDGPDVPQALDVDNIVILSPTAAEVKIKDTNYSIVPSESVLAIVYEK
jgi:co-chaperonin GroES (HSP10)